MIGSAPVLPRPPRHRPPVDEALTGAENLEIVGRLYHLGVRRRKKRARELLERFGPAEAADRPLNGLRLWVSLLIRTPEAYNNASGITVFPLVFLANTFTRLPAPLRVLADSSCR